MSLYVRYYFIVKWTCSFLTTPYHITCAQLSTQLVDWFSPLLDIALAALSQPQPATPTSSTYPTNVGLGNLSSAMLSAATGTAAAGGQQHHHKPPPLGAGGIGVLNNDAILSAYLGQSFGAGE